MPCRQTLKRNDVCLLSPLFRWARDRGPRVELRAWRTAVICADRCCKRILKLPIDLGSTLRLSSSGVRFSRYVGLRYFSECHPIKSITGTH